MSKWHSLLELVQFPLKILFIGTLLLGVGTAAVNPNIEFIWKIDNEILITLFNLMRYAGATIIQYFPLLVFVQVLSKKFESFLPVVMGIVAYLILNVTMAFFVENTFTSVYYKELLGINIRFDLINMTKAGTSYPFNTGIVSFLWSYYITMKCYQKSRRYSIFGFTSFIDHDAWAMLQIVLYSVISGIAFAYLWPFAILSVQYIFDLIASDIANPINLFIYGSMERIFSMLSLEDIPRNLFWFSELGGTWLNNVGIKYAGDVAVWTAQRNASIHTTTAGSFTTAYYIINIFLIPSFYIGYYTLCTAKYDRKRYFSFIVIACLLSIICGNPLPAEVMMMIISPLLYVIYIVAVGLLYAVLKISNFIIGYSFNEMLMLANPGSLLELLQYLRNPFMFNTVTKLLMIGFVVGIVFMVLTRLYFKNFAFGLFHVTNKEEVCDSILEDFGGIDNVISCDSTPDKLVVRFEDKDKVNYNDLRNYGAYMILDSKEGYLIRLGNVSTMVCQYIRKAKKNKPLVEKLEETKEISE